MSLLQAKDSNSQVVGAVIEFLASTTEMSSDRSVGETFRAELTLAIKIMLDLMSIGHGPPLNGSWWDHDVGSESVEDQQEVYAIAEQALDRMTRSLGENGNAVVRGACRDKLLRRTSCRRTVRPAHRIPSDPADGQVRQLGSTICWSERDRNDGRRRRGAVQEGSRWHNAVGVNTPPYYSRRCQ